MSRLIRHLLLMNSGSAPAAPFVSANRVYQFFAGDGISQPANVTAAGDGQPVDNWKSDDDASFAPSATLTVRPVYDLSNSAFNNRGVIVFDGTNDALIATIAAAKVANLSTYNIFWVLGTSDTVFGYVSVESRNDRTQFAHLVWNDPTSGDPQYRQTNGVGNAQIQAAASLSDGTPRLITLRRISAASWSLRVNGTQVATSSSDSGALAAIDRFAIGAHVNASSPLAMSLAYIAAYSDDNYIANEQAIGEYYGIAGFI